MKEKTVSATFQRSGIATLGNKVQPCYRVKSLDNLVFLLQGDEKIFVDSLVVQYDLEQLQRDYPEVNFIVKGGSAK